jgi:anti-sigma-K factor RskA
MSAHAEYAENVGAYALGALPELEAQVFERHLMACEECQEELQRLNAAVEALPRSVTPHQPPPSLKASLMDVVNTEAAQRPASARRRRFALPQLRPAIGWAAAACVLATGVGYGVSELGQDDGSEARTLSAQVDDQRLPGASASLSVSDDGSVLSVEGMPDAGRGRVYEVWVERDGDVEPASIFDVNDRGSGAAAVPGSLDDVDAVMVTREQRGGAEHPTEMPVLRVDV